MSELSKLAQEAINSKEVREAALTLAKYNLGICMPHMHDEHTGAILPLPLDMTSCEQNLRISFKRNTEIDMSMLPVAWRWNGTDIEICASCCAGSGPGDSHL